MKEPTDFTKQITGRDMPFALRVKGGSMEPRFKDGDVIFIDINRQPVHLSFVIAQLDGWSEITFKQLVIEGGRSFLRALNSERKIEIDMDVIIGVVTSISRAVEADPEASIFSGLPIGAMEV